MIAVVLSNGRCAANRGQRQEERAGHFQPEHLEDVSDASEGGSSCSVKGAYPAVFAALPSRDAEKRPALSTETAG